LQIVWRYDWYNRVAISHIGAQLGLTGHYQASSYIELLQVCSSCSCCCIPPIMCFSIFFIVLPHFKLADILFSRIFWSSPVGQRGP
jgi:hypothetical protein